MILRQVIIAYRNLTFEISPKQKQRCEDSGENAFYCWFFENRDPTSTYEQQYRQAGFSNDSKTREANKIFDASKFEPNATLTKLTVDNITNEVTQILSENLKDRPKDQEALKRKQKNAVEQAEKLTRLMIDFHAELVMLKKIQALDPNKLGPKEREKLEKFKDVDSNQRLKFLSYQIRTSALSLEDNYDVKISGLIIAACKEKADQQIAHKNKAAAERVAMLEQNINLDQVAFKISEYLEKGDEHSVYMAKTILKGQASDIIKIMGSHPTLFEEFMKHGDPETFQEVIMKLHTVCCQLDQQGRPWPGSVSLLMKS